MLKKLLFVVAAVVCGTFMGIVTKTFVFVARDFPVLITQMLSDQYRVIDVVIYSVIFSILIMVIGKLIITTLPRET